MATTLSSPKSRLIVLFGAGSTIHAGAPSTALITDHVTALPYASVKTIADALVAQRGSGGFNFETILYALEELDVYLLRGKVPTGWDLLGGVLSAFTKLADKCKGLEHDALLIDRLLVLASVAKFVWEKTKAASVLDIERFIDRLRNHFRLTVFTLNYDDIVDRAGSWFDGFTDAQLSPVPCFRFDPGQFRAIFHTDPEALGHLHGSVRFAHNDNGTEVVKYDSVDDSIKSLETPHLNAPAPIISGINKETKLVRNPIPLGYYYQAFIEAVLDSPRLLIAGFSGLDPHVTTWIMECARVHGTHARVVSLDIKKRAPLPASATFLPIETSFPPSDAAVLDRIVNHLLST